MVKLNTWKRFKGHNFKVAFTFQTAGINDYVDLRPFFFLGITFFLTRRLHELWRSVMTICLLTEVKAVMGYVSTWMGVRLSSRPAVGCV